MPVRHDVEVPQQDAIQRLGRGDEIGVKDLSALDPYYVLPILMTLTMVVQTKLNPVPPDPVQAQVMKYMPYVFSIFFFFFPAGLVLYWLVNNILSIAQQWQIQRMFNRDKPAHAKR